MRGLTLIATLLTSTAVCAEDAALLLGNERHATLDLLVGGTDVVESADTLGAVGFAVNANRNVGAGALKNAVQTFAGQADGADRIVAALSGHFATDGDRTWFLSADAATPSLFGIAGALSLESLMQVMDGPDGQSLLVLGLDAAEDDAYDNYLREGLGELAIPQGVTVVVGSPSAAAEFLADVAAPGADVMALVKSNRRLTALGYTPDSLVLVPAATQVTPPDENPVAIDTAAERALWDGARALDTEEAYRNYLNAYPTGNFVAEAEALITEITTEPNRAARLAEEALGLSRDARRDIQRDLTILDFNPRGIDGIFGPGTRSAVTNWQQQNGYSQTSYLDAEQINRLDAQAARRAAELEAEAERAREEQLRLDRAYWQETGAAGDEPGLRAYLERYPDGTFAAQATDQLDAIEAAKRAAAAAEDNAAWEVAVQANTVAAYQTYLQTFPDGALVEEARARISELQAPEGADEDAALATEAALGLNQITLQLVEARLGQLGLEPGTVDGTFDDDTRRAVRNFQRDRALEVTGFLNEETVVRLLADGLESLANE